jgi:hypothetical protein
MVVRTGRHGFQWMEPPYTPEEQKIVDRACSGPPIAIYRRREERERAAKSPAPQGSEAKPGQTPKRP